jgi:hypothetical protein
MFVPNTFPQAPFPSVPESIGRRRLKHYKFIIRSRHRHLRAALNLLSDVHIGSKIPDEESMGAAREKSPLILCAMLALNLAKAIVADEKASIGNGISIG